MYFHLDISILRYLSFIKVMAINPFLFYLRSSFFHFRSFFYRLSHAFFHLNLFTTLAPKLNQVGSPVSFEDFWISYNKRINDLNPSHSKKVIPPMGNHLVVGGVTKDGKSYACVHISKIINKVVPLIARLPSFNGTSKVLNLPEVFCFSEVERDLYPKKK